MREDRKLMAQSIFNLRAKGLCEVDPEEADLSVLPSFCTMLNHREKSQFGRIFWELFQAFSANASMIYDFPNAPTLHEAYLKKPK